ncbi:hypothetical protein [Alteribacillus iranensis]|uniref:Uncharacterized protein n=1 Tax=Alteribacillus iranensis TaxID=930128 RepID=A0A1I2D585_9BACI|nr:hypothetical protein [Alteribacillus iranensis]SFE75661.1 hypothetical protein SAMN05192532_103418 [Alteribacillus iranensis]
MRKTFEAMHEGHVIQVENTWFKGERLYIDGELQDENVGLALRASLRGAVTNHKGETQEIKVTLGGTTKIECKIFADNRLIESRAL